MLLERRAMMFNKKNPFIDGNKLYFYKEGLGWNTDYLQSRVGFNEVTNHAYAQAASGSYTQNNVKFNLPKSLNISNIYVDGLVNRPQSNYSMQINNDNASKYEIMQYSGATWNNGTTNRITHSETYTGRLKNGVARTFELRSNFVQLRVYNMWVVFNSL